MGRRLLTIDVDDAAVQGYSDEELRRLACKALAALRCCPYRQPVRPTRTLQSMQHLARERGGDCLSTRYHNGRTKLEWICKQGHTWQAVPGSICNGTWCPVCAIGRRIAKQRLSSLLSPDEWLEVLRRHARSKGGELLSGVYSNAKTRLRWRCKFDHEWQPRPSNVRPGTWCPQCARTGRGASQPTGDSGNKLPLVVTAPEACEYRQLTHDAVALRTTP